MAQASGVSALGFPPCCLTTMGPESSKPWFPHRGDGGWLCFPPHLPVAGGTGEPREACKRGEEVTLERRDVLVSGACRGAGRRGRRRLASRGLVNLFRGPGFYPGGTDGSEPGKRCMLFPRHLDHTEKRERRAGQGEATAGSGREA